MVLAVGYPDIAISHRSTQARTGISTGDGMIRRFRTAQSTAAMRRFGPTAIAALAAMAALMALTAEALARQARPAPTKEATASREAGEPLMAIVMLPFE
jgi:hypothetical protein